MCGGEVFFQFIDEYGKKWTYVSNDELWSAYITKGIQPHKTVRLNERGENVKKGKSQETQSFPTLLKPMLQTLTL